MLKSNLNIFLTLVLMTVLTQFILLRPMIGKGITNEDYTGFFAARFLKDKIISNPIKVWYEIGPHNATHVFYLFYLDLLFGDNYKMYSYVGIFLKMIATLSIYPLFLILSKKKLLAFLGTLLYGISFASSGPLLLYVVSDEYLGVFFMNLFLIGYYFLHKKHSFKLLSLSSLLMTLCFFVSPIRVYPIVLVIIFIELYLLFKYWFSNLLSTVIRISMILLPVLIILLASLNSISDDAYSLRGFPEFLKMIIDGNWYLLLNPFWGLGYTILPIFNLVFFGNIDVSSFMTYLYSLRSSFCIFAVVTFFLSLFLSKKSVRFFIILMFINFILDIFSFILFTHHFGISSSLVHGYDLVTFSRGMYANILANYVISVSITCLIEWYLTNKTNRTLFIIFISPFLSLLFIISQWIFTRHYAMYSGGMHRYFVIPEIGISLFIASIMQMVYQKKTILRLFKVIFLFLCLISIYNISFSEISKNMSGSKEDGNDLETQELMKEQLMSFIPNDRMKNDMLFFINFASGKTGAANHWEDVFDWRDMGQWIHIKRSYLTNSNINGCIVKIWDKSELQKIAKVQRGIKGFLYKGINNGEAICYKNGTGFNPEGMFFSMNDFYAIAIERRNVKNVTEEITDALSFQRIE